MDSEANSAQRWTWCSTGHIRDDADGFWVKYTDHSAKVRELEAAVDVLGHMWQCEARVNLFAKLPEHDCRKEIAGLDFDAAFQRVLENPIAAQAIQKARNDATGTT